VITADHGNADDMYERKKGEVVYDKESGQPKPKTAHSLNPVPVLVYDPDGKAGVDVPEQGELGISSLAATCLTLLGYQPPEGYTPSIVTVRT
jgi:2,3-bisphosphoglycerate-independent phosphoglycerate mutase